MGGQFPLRSSRRWRRWKEYGSSVSRRGRAARPSARRPITGLDSRLNEATGAFMDTAAVMMHLDLVATIDTSIAHVAGALGVPVWVAVGTWVLVLAPGVGGNALVPDHVLLPPKAARRLADRL